MYSGRKWTKNTSEIDFSFGYSSILSLKGTVFSELYYSPRKLTSRLGTQLYFLLPVSCFLTVQNKRWCCCQGSRRRDSPPRHAGRGLTSRLVCPSCMSPPSRVLLRCFSHPRLHISHLLFISITTVNTRPGVMINKQLYMGVRE